MTLDESRRDCSDAPFASIGTRMRHVTDAKGNVRLAIDTPMARKHRADDGCHYRIPSEATRARRLLRRRQREV